MKKDTYCHAELVSASRWDPEPSSGWH